MKAHAPPKGSGTRGLGVRLLGEVAVVRDGAFLALPPSKKTRALLGYLAATAASQSRQRLCDLLWDGPDDPRAALRWSLTKLRSLLDDENTVRLVADRERVVFEPHGARIDLFEALAHVGPGVASASTDALRQAAAALSGDFLEGLDMPDCYRFHEWCTGQRERVRALRLSVLDALVERLVDDLPEEALGPARQRLLVDPLSDLAHATVVKLLARLGRNGEAQAQVDACRRILERELGGRRSPALEVARAQIGRTTAPPEALGPPSTPGPTPPLTDAARSSRKPQQAPALVARQAEVAVLANLVRDARGGRASKVVLLSGEPGIGKSRLLGELARLTRAAGGAVLSARAFEAEAVRPFGIWVDLLRHPAIELGGEHRHALAPLFPELGEARGDAESRARLFDGVARLLRELSARVPLVLAVDDLQWLDEASSGLLHYVARLSAATGMAIACATRDGELEDNAGALRFVRALRREGRLIRLPLAPLDEADTGALLRSSGVVGADAAQVFHESGGNPFFALEMARSLASGAADGPQAIEDLIEERLARLDPRARDLVLWAAAFGREFDPETLASVSGESLAQTVGTFGELEQHGLLTTSGVRYAFTHELVRQAAYRQLSGPRRRLVHLTIARALAAVPDAGIAWGDVVHHATLADDASLVATACVAAGERALKMLARASARDFATRGLAQTARLGLAGLALRADLLHVAALSTAMNPQRNAAFEEDAEDAVRMARDVGRPDIAARALFALGFLRSARGDFEGAHEVTLGAAEAARATTPAESAPTLANTAFCLALIERELPKARALLDEVAETARMHRLSIIDIELCDGYLAHMEGNLVHARAALDRSLALARARTDSWRESMALIRQAMIAIESRSWGAARAHAAELRAVATKLDGDGSEGVIAEGLDALALHGSGNAEGGPRLSAAIEALALADAKTVQAYILTIAAELAIGERDFGRAHDLASRALFTAEPLGKPSALVLAHVVLGRAAVGTGDAEAAREHLVAARALLEHPHGVSRRAREATLELAAISNAFINAGVHAVGANPHQR